ncbi:MAG: flavodoxin family protein [Tissierellaceae bacterium]|nr:flavodoxin family protein [Tissierellaceae bacterium]
MKICMINGSPKAKDSCSRYLIDEIIKLMDDKTEVLMCDGSHKPFKDDMFQQIYNCDKVVFVFPLYVDAVPSHLVYFLESFQEYIRLQPVKNISVYAVSNCGFYEGEQNKYALKIIENFCEDSGLNWQFGIGTGTGPFVAQSQTIPWQSSIKRPIYQALLTLKKGLEEGYQPKENIFVTAKMPRYIYIASAHAGWRLSAKKNNLRFRDI